MIHPKMPQCPIHRCFYPFGGECFDCVVDRFKAEDAEKAKVETSAE